MSQNQSRAERSESTQYRKTGRSISSNQQHHFGSGKGGGGSSTPTNPFNRSFKKNNNNAQGGQSRERHLNVSSDSSNSSLAPLVQNGVLQQQPPPRVSDTHVSSTTASVNQPDVQNPKITQAVPKVLSSNVSTAISDSQAMTTSAKDPGDASRPFPLQFGSISPGFMNGMQIPARTNSCPPNLDEQKKNQARHEALTAVPTMPAPSLPKHHLPKNEARILDQPNAGGAQPMPKSKRDLQVSSALPVSQTQKPPVHSIPGMPMQLPFHQPQVAVHFGGHNPQIQSQPMTGTSLPMPMPMALTMGNPSVQQPLFVSGLQPHPMQSQGIMHQGQSLNFSSQMGPQMLPQLGNMGINMAPQFPQQQVGKSTTSRKTVKITHPETHEELLLDGSPGLRSHPNMPPQSQPIPSFPPNHLMNYYPNSYNATSLFFPSVSSVPLNSTQAPPSQPPRFYNQVTIKPAGGSHWEKDALLPTSSPSVEKVDSSKVLRSLGEGFVGLQKEFESSSSSSLQPSKRSSDASSTSASVLGPISVKNDVLNTASSALAIVDDSASISCSSAKEARNESTISIESVNDKNRKPGDRGQQHQVDGRSTSLLSLVSQLPGAEALAAKSSSTIMVLETSEERFSTTLPVTSESFTITCEGAGEGKTQESSKSLGAKGVKNKQSKPETMRRKEQGDTILSESSKPDAHGLETSLKSLSIDDKVEEISDQDVTSFADGSLAHAQQKLEESFGFCSDDVKVADNIVTSACMIDGGNVGSSMRVNDLFKQDDKTSSSDASISLPNSVGPRQTTGTKSDVVDYESSPVLVPIPSEGAMKEENEDIENNNSGLASLSLSSVKEKVLSEPNAARNTVVRVKKKRKDLYRKAEAAGTSSDLYMAYKGPEEMKETEISADGTEITSSIGIKQTCVIASQETAMPSNESVPSKVEPDDWEDAAEISTPQLETSRDKNEGDGGDGNGLMTNRYSRGFLLKFAEQCADLPENFEIASDIADVLMVSSANVLREPYPSPGRNIDWPIGGSRPDRRGTGMGEEDKWSKLPGPLMSGRGDMWTDVGYAGNITGFRPGQVGNYGVLRNPRAVTPFQYAGGILSGPMQSPGPQGGLQRYNFDSERWQRGTGFQKGLMPSPLTPLQMMHKAEKKYEVGKVSDEEENKQRQLKAILNKLTPQNFEKLFEQVKQVNIDNVVTLSGVISQIFDKALMEPTFCEMYANFCFYLAGDLPDLSVDNEKITFKRLLLNKCQEEFERGKREEEEANKADEEGEDKQTIEEREGKRLQARRRMLGNIKLIGELYKKRMLTERIMHECINNLLGQYQYPDEENVEALCKLMSTIGEMIDHPIAKEHMDAYFEIMAQLSNNMQLSSRVRFMLKDAIDLRKNKWQQRRKVEGPKKIEEVHRDAAQERHAQGSRLARSPSIGSSVRRGPPMDFAPRVPSMLSSPSSQMGGFRAVPPHLRGSGSQDVRLEAYENRTMSVPLPQRPLGDDSITLGPQGGLARGMAFRGQPSVPNIPVAEVPSPGDARRIGLGLNGFRSMPEQTAYGQREDLIPKYVPERFSSQSVYDQSHPQERSMTYGNRDVRNADRAFDRSILNSPPSRGEPPHIMQNISSEKVWPEERLRDMSMATIKEFYSIKEVNEVISLIKDLNCPSFYPSMICIWVTDSFERKDMERDLLTKLLINLTKCRDTLISEDQLVKGFESVLTILEDAVNDAPRAAEFLGRIFAKVILENVISLSEIGRLIFEGGEEQGRLVETGLAAEVLGSILEIVRLEKGDSVLNEICSGSNLQLENFRPPGSNKSWRIDKFI